MKRLLRVLYGRDSGQTIIFFAILSAALMGTVGLAVEGGRVFVEYRRVQAAADMAALVGAQKLPCNTTDTSCITNAESQACTYASSNGFSTCSNGTTSAPAANVPPVSCSPYDFMDYGNGSSNGSCKTASAPPFYDYIEVRLQDNLGTVPIFNIPVTLSAHAVAKHGVPSSGDYALITLDPNTQLSIGGSAVVALDGSAFANGGISGGGASNSLSCDGGWFSAGSVSGVGTDDSGSPIYAPDSRGSATCTGSNDSTTVQQGSLPDITDPYAGSTAPPTLQSGTSSPAGSSAMVNCPECGQAGWYYDLDAHTWTQGGDVGGCNVELFPGVYGTFSLGNKCEAYFNPGVYTFTGGYDSNHGTMCVYGAPDCDNSNCSSTSFQAGQSAADQWLYACSPYGFWDSSSISGRPSALSTTPTFYDASTGLASTTALNGVAIYVPSTASNSFTSHGNSGKNGGVFLAASDPCPGTGSYTAYPPGAVTFPSGSASGVFSYTNSAGTNSWSLPHGVTSSSAGVVYPSMDFSLQAECTGFLLDWSGELTKPQHLHFLWYILGSQSMKINGASAQQWTGIFYAPASSVTINGAGKGAGGPPWITGQFITYNASFSGHSYEDIDYRGCGTGSTPCGSGYGTQLVQ